MSDDDTIRLDFEWGEWIKSPNGNVAFDILLTAEAGNQGKHVMVRAAVVGSADHTQKVVDGTAKPVIIQLRFPSIERARSLAAELELAADRAEGKPKGKH